MGYLIGDRLAMLHIPKTGGIWVRGACQAMGLPWRRYGPSGMAGDQHSDEPTPEVWRQTMTFVRHPVDWLRSFWMFHERTGWRQYTDAPAYIFYACHRPGMTFEAFVTEYLDRMPGAIGRMFMRYTDNAHLVGKTETLLTDLAEFLYEGAGIPKDRTIKLAGTRGPTSVSGPAWKQKALLPDHLRQMVLREEHVWMEDWGYRDQQ